MASKELGWVVAAGVFLRLALFYLGLTDVLESRVEVSSPSSSFKRISEGVYLIKQNVPLYEGDVVHQPPLLVFMFYALSGLAPAATQMLYIFIDCVTAVSLSNLVEDESDSGRKAKKAGLSNQKFLSVFVAAIYLLNPFTLVSCVGMSTLGFSFAATSVSLVMASKGKLISSTCSLAVSTYVDVYPLLLLIPLICLLRKSLSSPFKLIATKVCASYIVWLLILMSLSCFLLDDFSLHWIRKTYGHILMFTESTPNLGLFWYFFLQIFERFWSFFLAIFHFHIFVYILPLGMHFKDRPVFLTWCVVALTSIFKAYPVIGDTAFAYVFFACNFPLVKEAGLKPNFFLFYLILNTCCCMFTFWFLWIYSGSGNANFYYFQSLIFCLCNCIMFVQIVGSVRKYNVVQTNPGLAKKLKEKVS